MPGSAYRPARSSGYGRRRCSSPASGPGAGRWRSARAGAARAQRAVTISTIRSRSQPTRHQPRPRVGRGVVRRAVHSKPQPGPSARRRCQSARPPPSRPAFRILLQAPPQHLRIGVGVSGGNMVQSGSSFSTAASPCEMVSPWKGRRPVSISMRTTPNDHMSLRLSATFPSACCGGHAARGAPGRRRILTMT